MATAKTAELTPLEQLDQQACQLQQAIAEEASALQILIESPNLTPREPSEAFRNLDEFLKAAQNEQDHKQRIAIAQTALAQRKELLEKLQKRRGDLDRQQRHEAARAQLEPIAQKIEGLNAAYLAEIGAIARLAQTLASDFSIRIDLGGIGPGSISLDLAKASMNNEHFLLGHDFQGFRP